MGGELAALQDILPTHQEQQIYDWWDQLDAMVWQLAEKASKDKQAPREVQQVRRLKKVMNASTIHMVSEDGWKMVRQNTHKTN